MLQLKIYLAFTHLNSLMMYSLLSALSFLRSTVLSLIKIYISNGSGGPPSIAVATLLFFARVWYSSYTDA